MSAPDTDRILALADDIDRWGNVRHTEVPLVTNTLRALVAENASLRMTVDESTEIIGDLRAGWQTVADLTDEFMRGDQRKGGATVRAIRHALGVERFNVARRALGVTE